MRNGVVSKIATKATYAAENMKINKFEELTKDGYQEVSKKTEEEILYVIDGEDRTMIDLNMELYSIYVATCEGDDAVNGDAVDGFRPGTYKDIDKGDWIRAYDVTKDDDGVADVIFVLKAE